MRIASGSGTCGRSTSQTDAISSSGSETPEWPSEADPLPLPPHSCNHFPHSTGFLNYKWDEGYTSLAQNKCESSAAGLPLLLSAGWASCQTFGKKRERKEKENLDLGVINSAGTLILSATFPVLFRDQAFNSNVQVSELPLLPQLSTCMSPLKRSLGFSFKMRRGVKQMCRPLLRYCADK